MKLLPLILLLLAAPNSIHAAEGDALNATFPLPLPLVNIYQGASGTLSSTSTAINYTTATYENMPGVYSGGALQCGSGGVFSVSASLAINATIALNNSLSLEIWVNGASKRKVSVALPALLTKASISVSNIVNCPASGTIQIVASSNAINPTITTDPSENTFTALKLFVNK